MVGPQNLKPRCDNSFDIATVGYGLRNLADWESGLREMRRVAKPGGRLVVLDFGKPDNPLWRALYFGYLKCCVPVFGLLFARRADAYAYILESLKHYPAALRRVRYFDAEHQRFLVFLTNNFELPALTIADLYKSRWQVELFFKWIKQHLRIKVFLGTSQNAVKTQIWIAISIDVLAAIVKKELNLSASLYQILQVISVTIFERTPILQALQLQHTGEKSDPFFNQLNLFDL